MIFADLDSAGWIQIPVMAVSHAIDTKKFQAAWIEININ